MMFKVAAATDPLSIKVAKDIISRVYSENPAYWPNGFSADGFDGGLFLVMTKRSSHAVGVVGWQERFSRDASRQPVKVGYYSVAILPEHRQNGYAKEAVAKLIGIKAAGVDVVRAMICAANIPSLALAESLGVQVKLASIQVPGLLKRQL